MDEYEFTSNDLAALDLTIRGCAMEIIVELRRLQFVTAYAAHRMVENPNHYKLASDLAADAMAEAVRFVEVDGTFPAPDPDA